MERPTVGKMLVWLVLSVMIGLVGTYLMYWSHGAL